MTLSRTKFFVQLPVNIADITASKLRYAQTLQWPNSLGSKSSGINLWPSYVRKSVETYFCLIFVLKMFKTSSQVELGASLALILCLSNLKLKTVFFYTTVSFFFSLCFINLSPCWLFELFIFNFSQEEEILDLLEQCETDENVTFDMKSGIRPIRKGPKVKKLYSMLVS